MSIQYVASNNIKMYPSANRDHTIDPESYLNTEFNLVNYKKMSTLIGGWVDEKTINDHKYYTICLGGYVFVVSLPSNFLSSSNNIYCGIRLVTPTGGTYTNPYLANVSNDETPSSLDVGGEFQGLGFSANTGDLSACNYVLHMLTKSNGVFIIPSESKCKLDSSEIFNSIPVSDNDSYNVPISEKFKTVDLYATSITGNLTGNVTGDVSGNAGTVTTTSDTSSDLYVVGVTSDATTSLKRDTSITIKGAALTAQKLIASKTTSGTTTTTTIEGGNITANTVNATDLKVTSNYIQLDGYNNNKKKDLLNSLNDLSATGVYLKGVNYDNTTYNNSSATWLKVDGTSNPSKETIPKRVEKTISGDVYYVLYGPFSGTLYGDVTGKVTYNISSDSDSGGLLIHSTHSGSTSNDTTYYYNKLQYKGANSSGVKISRDYGVELLGEFSSGIPNTYLKITPSKITDVYSLSTDPTNGTSIDIKGNITTRSGNIGVSNGTINASKTVNNSSTTTTIEGANITATGGTLTTQKIVASKTTSGTTTTTTIDGGSITTASIRGNLTGNVTGDVSGNVTGNVTGDLTGSASKSVITSDTASDLYLVGVINTTGTSLPLLRDTSITIKGDTLTGNVTGNLTGNVTGNLTGTASNATDSVWATKIGTNATHPAIGSTTAPVYINSNGAITQASTYAGGTNVTLNNSSKGGSTATIFAPESAGTSGQWLCSNGSASTSTDRGPIWKNSTPFMTALSLSSANTYELLGYGLNCMFFIACTGCTIKQEFTARVTYEGITDTVTTTKETSFLGGGTVYCYTKRVSGTYTSIVYIGNNSGVSLTYTPPAGAVVTDSSNAYYLKSSDSSRTYYKLS